MSVHRRLALLALTAGTLALAACAHDGAAPHLKLGARPWERDVLARKSMQLAVEPALLAFDDHTYFSKEAAAGGRGFDGGGCGCN